MTTKTSTTIKTLSLAGAAGLALTFAGGAVPAMAAGVTGNTTDHVNIRAQANTSSDLLGVLEPGTDVTVNCQTSGEAVSGTYNSDQWAQVDVDGQTGYVTRAYLTIADAAGLGACADAPEAPEAPVDPGQGAGEHAQARQQVIDRGNDWVAQGIGYSMNATHPDRNGTPYRTDCSGFVAMAYDLGNNYSTVNLTEQFSPINKEDLLPGDIIGNLGPGTGGAEGHVVIFTGWTDESQTSFNVIEQRGGDGAVAATHTWGDSFWNNQAYRFNGYS